MERDEEEGARRIGTLEKLGGGEETMPNGVYV